MAILAGCYPVIVPPTPGVLSALGFLYSDIKNEFAHTLIRTMDEVRAEEVADALAGLGRRRGCGSGTKGSPRTGGRSPSSSTCATSAKGTSSRSRWTPRRSGRGGSTRSRSVSGELHERQYGFRLDQPVELVNARAVAVGRVVKVEFPRFDAEGAGCGGPRRPAGIPCSSTASS